MPYPAFFVPFYMEAREFGEVPWLLVGAFVAIVGIDRLPGGVAIVGIDQWEGPPWPSSG